MVSRRVGDEKTTILAEKAVPVGVGRAADSGLPEHFDVLGSAIIRPGIKFGF